MLSVLVLEAIELHQELCLTAVIELGNCCYCLIQAKTCIEMPHLHQRIPSRFLGHWVPERVDGVSFLDLSILLCCSDSDQGRYSMIYNKRLQPLTKWDPRCAKVETVERHSGLNHWRGLWGITTTPNKDESSESYLGGRGAKLKEACSRFTFIMSCAKPYALIPKIVGRFIAVCSLA